MKSYEQAATQIWTHCRLNADDRKSGRAMQSQQQVQSLARLMETWARSEAIAVCRELMMTERDELKAEIHRLKEQNKSLRAELKATAAEMQKLQKPPAEAEAEQKEGVE